MVQKNLYVPCLNLIFSIIKMEEILPYQRSFETIECVVIIIPAKLGSKVIKKLDRLAPKGDMNYLKRVRKHRC